MKLSVNIFLFLLLSICTFGTLYAQDAQSEEEKKKAYEKELDEIIANTNLLEMEVVNGDTLPIYTLPEFYHIDRKFSSSEDRFRYNKMQRIIKKVYPYATKASDLMEQIQQETHYMNKKRHEKKYLKTLEKELKVEFEDQLKNLTVSQGRVLIKLIERETGQSMNNIIKDYKNPVSAMVWTTLSKRFGYDLKKGYDPEDPEFPYLESIVNEIETYGWEAYNIVN